MVNKFFILLINAYQKLISPLLGSNCRFYPTCSCYTKRCFQKYPFFKALFTSLSRIIKCHPFNSGGYDPVPKERLHE